MKYKLHFRQTDFPLVFTDAILEANSYGDFSYIILQKRDSVSAYLSPKGVKEYYRQGESLLNKNFANKIICKLENFYDKISNLEILEDIKKREDYNLHDWTLIVSILRDIGKNYKYCEQPMLIPLEKLILKGVHDNGELIKLLKDSKNNKKKLNKKEGYVLDALTKLGELKLKIHEEFSPYVEIINSFAFKIAKDNFLTKNQADVLMIKEVNQLLKGEKIDIDEVNKRVNGCVWVKEGFKWRCYGGDMYNQWKERFNVKNSIKIVGNSAYPGKITGKVKIHLSLTATAKIPKNCVLITGMTNPQIISLLPRVSAIVTDEGGITCHAAIVSREFKIPCITGTENATQVFKDGDIVEVDANQGIIKKIKHL